MRAMSLLLRSSTSSMLVKLGCGAWSGITCGPVVQFNMISTVAFGVMIDVMSDMWSRVAPDVLSFFSLAWSMCGQGVRIIMVCIVWSRLIGSTTIVHVACLVDGERNVPALTLRTLVASLCVCRSYWVAFVPSFPVCGLFFFGASSRKALNV